MVFTRTLTPSETSIILKLQEFVKAAHAESNSHDYAHVLSVCRYAIQIGKTIQDNVDPFILSAGALLHDIGKTNAVFSHIHGLFGGSLAEEFLDGLKIDPEIRDAICRVVIRHTPTSMIPPETPEEMAVYDADTLDRLGLMGLLRGFIGKEGAMDKIMSKYMTSRKLDFEKLHYSVSKDIGLEADQMMGAFIQIIEDRLKIRMHSIEDLFLKEGLINSQNS
ncbi:MAG: HD domain-containing protein [Promethearchaeota archaeon]|nr:MAG: HD domain-containing protein [Candidatus Lokiarchaeota archaeon]